MSILADTPAHTAHPVCPPSGFTAPVYPGQELETSVWHVGEKDGYVEIAFEQAIVGGKKSLGGGYALVKKGSAPAKFRL